MCPDLVFRTLGVILVSDLCYVQNQEYKNVSKILVPNEAYASVFGFTSGNFYTPFGERCGGSFERSIIIQCPRRSTLVCGPCIQSGRYTN